MALLCLKGALIRPWTITEDVEQHFLCSLAFHMYPLVKCLCKYFAELLILKFEIKSNEI
jgi:hypothetical protein